MPSIINPYTKVCSGDAISTTSLGAYYKFNGDVTDSSGNGLNGTAYNTPAYVAGKYQNGIKLNGTSQYVSVSDNTLFEGSGGNISVFAWINCVDFEGPCHIAAKYSASFTGYRLVPRGGLDTLVSMGGVNISRGVGPSANTWAHLGFTYNNNVLKIYLNGVQDGTDATIGAQTIANTEIFTIGRSSQGSFGFCNGSIDELNVWQRVLSSTEVANLYNSTCPLKA
jgi:hypothetical protein